MRRSLFLLACLIACSRQPSTNQYTFKLAVSGRLLPVAHDIDQSYAVLASDLVYESFLRLEPDGERLWSRLLERWELSPWRGRVLVKEGLRFSDGSLVDIEDVVRSMRDMKLTVRPDGRWLELEPVERTLPLDVALLRAVLYKSVPGGEIGTGPFRLVRQDGGSILLERVRPVSGKIGRIEIMSFPSGREGFARALKGDVNGVIDIDGRQAELLAGVPGLQLVEVTGRQSLVVEMNARRLDRSTRRELAEKLPLEEIELAAVGKRCASASGRRSSAPISPGSTIGVATLAGSDVFERAALALRRSLGARGGAVVRVQPDSEFQRALSDSALSIYYLWTWPRSYAAVYWKTGSPWNTNGYSNPSYDAAVEAGDLVRAEAELSKDPPVVVLCPRKRIAAIDARIVNPTLSRGGPLDTLPDWEVRQ